MGQKGNIDPTLRALGSRGKYQLLQTFVIGLGSFGAAFQLLDNIFIGKNNVQDIFEHITQSKRPIRLSHEE